MQRHESEPFLYSELVSGARLAYKTFGSGEHLILAFHGYGVDSSIFKVLADSWPETQIISFDLFYHGGSIWPDHTKPIAWEDLSNLLNELPYWKSQKKVTLMGYSLGARLAMGLAMLRPKNLSSVWLIAPDRIHTSAWYALATKNQLTRWLFKLSMKNSEALASIVDQMQTYKLLPSTLIKFVKVHLLKEGEPERVYKVWVSFRKLTVRKDQWVKMANANKVKTVIIAGRYDQVVPIEPLEQFSKKLDYCKFLPLSEGHNKLIKKLAEELKKW